MKQGIYIVVSPTEIVKADVEKPYYDHYFYANKLEEYKIAIKKYQEHCLSLPRIPIHGKNNWKVWQEVKEGKDFTLGWFVKTESYQGEGGGLFDTEKEAENKYGEWSKYDGQLQSKAYRPIIVAIPIEQTKSEQVEFSESEMKKVQDDIDSVNAGAIVDKVKLSGFPCDINELCDVLQNTCQLLNGIKPDAVEEKWWSDWDESVLESLVKMLQQVQPFYKK